MENFVKFLTSLEAEEAKGDGSVLPREVLDDLRQMLAPLEPAIDAMRQFPAQFTTLDELTVAADAADRSRYIVTRGLLQELAPVLASKEGPDSKLSAVLTRKLVELVIECCDVVIAMPAVEAT